jgi:hypothetical protein
MQVARLAGFPVPRVIRYGDHPDTPHAPVSILMTRVPGEELGQVYETLSDEDKNSILEELKGYISRDHASLVKSMVEVFRLSMPKVYREPPRSR